MNYLRRCTAFAFLCVMASPAQAQDKFNDRPTLEKAVPALESDVSATFDGRITEATKTVDTDAKFRALRTIRNELTRTIDEAKAQRTALQDQITGLLSTRKELLPANTSSFTGEPPSETVERSLVTTKEKIKQLESKLNALKSDDPAAASLRTELNNATASQRNIEQYISALKGRRDFAAKQARDLEALDHKVESLRTQEANLDRSLKKLTLSQSALDDEINGALSTEGQRNSFKTWIAAAFTFLVLVVITGFFVTAWRDEVVGRAIFSGESGIQFLTLFAVVIAIILFGITGILESKELSALLGGLSGYILGRVTTGPTRTQDPAPALHPALIAESAPAPAPAAGP